ncbi:MAG: NAD-dependent epimerase/dehydratase family protein [Myxococcales bacterium]|nr:MAG: NAD-dependent epimerase/dehydratase family protein [Myxococcales bacterium]
MTVIVTGAAGHVGNSLVRLLLERGESVRAMVHQDRRALDELDVECVSADVTDVESLKAAFVGCDIVYHAAAFISIWGSRDAAHLRKVNIEGTANVLTACKAAGVRRLAHVSSIHALSPYPEAETIDETREASLSAKFPHYDRSKAESERLAFDAAKGGLEVVVIIPTAVIGPHDYKPSLQGRMLMDYYNHRLPTLVDGGYNWVDVRDVAEGMRLAAERGRSGERYILGGVWASFSDLAALINTVPGARAPRLVAPHWMAYLGVPFAALQGWLTGKRPLLTSDAVKVVRLHRHISTAKAERELGYVHRPLAETVADAYAWFDKHGLLNGKAQ